MADIFRCFLETLTLGEASLRPKSFSAAIGESES
jgi:hypothetical protein